MAKKTTLSLSGLILLYSQSAFANANGRKINSLPEFETFFNNIVALPALTLTILRIGMMVAGLFIACVAVYFWVVSAKVVVGHQPKFISPQKLPSPSACMVLLFVGVFLFLLGDGFFGLATAVNSVSGQDIQSMYSVVKYDSTKDTTELLNMMVLSLVKSIGALLGFIGMMSIGFDLRASALQQKEHSTAKIILKFIASGFIAMPIMLNDFIGNTIGFNVLRFLFG